MEHVGDERDGGGEVRGYRRCWVDIIIDMNEEDNKSRANRMSVDRPHDPITTAFLPLTEDTMLIVLLLTSYRVEWWNAIREDDEECQIDRREEV